MPDTPMELRSLPSRARLYCPPSYDPSNPGASGTYVWEYPGITPERLDPISIYSGYRGKILGVARDCSEVEVVDFAWSELDGEFWLWIEPVPAKERRVREALEVHPETWMLVEPGPVAGWISHSAVEFDK